MRQYRKMDKAIIQSTHSYDVTTVDVLVLCSLSRHVTYQGMAQNVKYSFSELVHTVLPYREAEHKQMTVHVFRPPDDDQID
jgi:hypothetical protein